MNKNKKKNIDRLLKEGYIKMAGESLKITKEFEAIEIIEDIDELKELRPQEKRAVSFDGYIKKRK